MSRGVMGSYLSWWLGGNEGQPLKMHFNLYKDMKPQQHILSIICALSAYISEVDTTYPCMFGALVQPCERIPRRQSQLLAAANTCANAH